MYCTYLKHTLSDGFTTCDSPVLEDHAKEGAESLTPLFRAKKVKRVSHGGAKVTLLNSPQTRLRRTTS